LPLFLIKIFILSVFLELCLISGISIIIFSSFSLVYVLGVCSTPDSASSNSNKFKVVLSIVSSFLLSNCLFYSTFNYFSDFKALLKCLNKGSVWEEDLITDFLLIIRDLVSLLADLGRVLFVFGVDGKKGLKP
jgi:hypothetical protein